MALALLATVFVGFARTYYLAGVFHAPLPAPIIHVHGALFSTWILLLISQTSLVAAHRVNIHRRLGIAGFVLACVMVVVGLLAAANALTRDLARPGFDAKAFFIIPFGDMVIFATLIAFAFRARKDSAAHKRLIMVATTSLMIAAVARWPVSLVYHHAPVAALFTYVFLLALVAYDLWSTHKIHRATLWASAFLIFVQQVRLPISHTGAWHVFAGWVQTVAK
jgi:FtsH-binding integral membrane protein